VRGTALSQDPIVDAATAQHERCSTVKDNETAAIEWLRHFLWYVFAGRLLWHVD
jgi:hypothetical protein